MKNTKQKILDEARKQFNEKGVSETTLRQIASALDMSQGNLNYHFKTRQDLAEALYFELVSKMDQEMNAVSTIEMGLDLLYLSSKHSMSHLYEYRFLLKSSLQVMKLSETIKKHFFELQTLRRQQFLKMFDLLIQQGIMRPKEYEQEYDNLYERMQILGDNWISTQELMKPDLDDPVEYYCHLLFDVIYPYLTELGKKKFLEVKRKQF